MGEGAAPPRRRRALFLGLHGDPVGADAEQIGPLQRRIDRRPRHDRQLAGDLRALAIDAGDPGLIDDLLGPEGRQAVDVEADAFPQVLRHRQGQLQTPAQRALRRDDGQDLGPGTPVLEALEQHPRRGIGRVLLEAAEDAGPAAALLVEIGDLVAQQQIEPAPPARDEPAKHGRDAGPELAEPPAEEPGRQR